MGSRIKDSFPEQGGLFESLQFCSERTNNIPQKRAAVPLSTSASSCSDLPEGCAYSQPRSAASECTRNKADGAITFLSGIPTGYPAERGPMFPLSGLQTSPKRGESSVQWLGGQPGPSTAPCPLTSSSGHPQPYKAHTSFGGSHIGHEDGFISSYL